MNQNISVAKCEKCGSSNLSDGSVVSSGFAQKGGSAYSCVRVEATACKDCGALFNLRLEKPEKLK